MRTKPILFTMQTERVFSGFTDGTHWNGWANVRVTAQTHAVFVAHSIAEHGEDSGLGEITADADGLFDYGRCFCSELVDVDEHGTETVLRLIDEQQTAQKSVPPTSADWRHASALLAMLFAEMARRTS